MRDYKGTAEMLKTAVDQGDEIFMVTALHNKHLIVHALECAAVVEAQAKTLQFKHAYPVVAHKR